MPGRIMTAQQAVKEYGKEFKSIKKHGHKVTVRNSEGDKITIGKNKEIYHRGHGQFGIYSTAEDEAKHKKGAHEKIGTGGYRQTNDRRIKTRKGKGRIQKRR